MFDVQDAGKTRQLEHHDDSIENFATTTLSRFPRR